MNPCHHPSELILLAHAAGRLGQGPALVVASHLAACPDCRRETALAEALGGTLLEALPAADLAPDALARALAAVERPVEATRADRAAPAAGVAVDDWIEVPAEVLGAFRLRRRWAAPGVWVAPVTHGPGRRRSYLLRVAAGMSVPRHGHAGSEFVCVLKGAYVDRGVTHGRGDFAENDDDVDHRPEVTADGECICLICADAPLIPRDWVGRLFQPLVRI